MDRNERRGGNKFNKPWSNGERDNQQPRRFKDFKYKDNK
jgi:hypothetical protein